MSYLSRHRPICTVIQEIKKIAEEQYLDPLIIELCDEATEYAQSMSKRLQLYKDELGQERVDELVKGLK